mmetsp:Transcript_35559/g.77153  ORF Transcript_35559/g.77153 Transcript_35559/m.77153 type:complete len:308 (+) Transcript_35559:307-1230(+)
MAAVVLVLAEDIGGDTHRAPFVNSVVRAIDALSSETAEDGNNQVSRTNPQQQQHSPPIPSVTAPASYDEVDDGGRRGDGPVVIGSPSRLPSRGNWGGRVAAEEAGCDGQSLQQQHQQHHKVQPSNEIYLLVCGSKRHASHLKMNDAVPPNLAVGGSLERLTHRSDWDRAWTSGEQIFGDIINGVGIDKFGPRTNLWAQLIDVGNGQELVDVAKEVENALTRKYCDGVASVYMLIPARSASGGGQSSTGGCSAGESSGEREQQQQKQQQFVQDMDLGRVKQIFESVWERDGSILRHATVEFVTRSRDR